MIEGWQLDLRGGGVGTSASDYDADCLFAAWPTWPILLPRAAGLREGGFDAAALLWRDRDVVYAPQENAGRVLALVHRVLSRRPLRGVEDEFLRLYSRVAAADPRVVNEVWSDPRASHWTRVAYPLLSASLAGTELPPLAAGYCKAIGEVGPGAALARHLDQFKVLVLGVAFRSGEDCTFEKPLRTGLPFAVPGSRWSLDGEGDVEVWGLFDGRLSVSVGGEAREVTLSAAGRSGRHAGFLRECPLVSHDEWTLPLQPHAFNVPGSPIAEPAVRAGLDYDEWHAPLVQEALGHMQRYLPETFDDFRRAIHVAALKPRHWSFYDDYSDPDMPGAFISSAIPNGLEMADHFLHQFQHIRLSCIEEYGPLFDCSRGDAYGDASYYSPWRDKLRAIYGIYHGVYVVIALSRYWLNVYEANAVGAQDRAYAVDCLLRLPRQLVLALGVLRKYAALTPLGQTIFEQYARDVDGLRKRLGSMGLPADARALKVAEDGGYVPELSRSDGRPLTVMGVLREHLRTNDTANQCAGLVEELG